MLCPLELQPRNCAWMIEPGQDIIAVAGNNRRAEMREAIAEPRQARGQARGIKQLEETAFGVDNEIPAKARGRRLNAGPPRTLIDF